MFKWSTYKPHWRITIVYLLVASVWILFSDSVLFHLGIQDLHIPSLSTIKGIGFVVVTSALLYIHLRREFSIRSRLERKLIEQVRDLKSSQEELAQSEKRFRKAVEEAPLPILIFAEDGEVITVSHTWLEITGYAVEQIATLDDWTRLAYGESKHIMRSVIDALFDIDSRVDEGEFEIRCADGSKRIWLFSSTPLGRLPDKRRIVISIAADITKQKELERSIASTNAFLQTLFNASPLGVLTFDFDGTVQLWNPAMEEILGWTADEAVGRRVPFVRETDLDEYQSNLERVISGKPIRGMELKRQRKDGSKVILDISAGLLTDPNTNESSIIGIIQDTTDRKRMENALKESELRFRQIAENINEIFYLNDAQTGDNLYISPAYETLWEQSRESLKQDSSSFLTAVHPDDLDSVVEGFRRQREGKPIEITHRIMQSDHSIRWIRTRSFPVYDENGELHRTAGIIEDITQRVRDENKLRRLSQRLVTLLDTERARIARELHDQIGQQLTGLSLNLAVVSAQPGQNGETVRILDDSTEIISNIIERIRHIIANLRPLALDDMGLGAGLRWYCETFTRRTGIPVQLSLPQKNLTFTPSIDNSLYQIAKEALTNIAKHAEATQITLDFEVKQNHLMMTISDNGKGFDIQEVLSNESSGNWGIRIMQERIQTLAGSKLNISSEPGQGTELSIIVQL